MKRQILKPLITLSLVTALSFGTSAGAFALTSSSKAAPAASEKEYVGYLIDAHCNKVGKSEMGNIEVKKNPEKHQTACLKMKNCMDSGLGLMVKEGKTYKFYSFDKVSSKKADDTVMMKTKKKFNNKVAVKATVKSNVLSISSIKEVK